MEPFEFIEYCIVKEHENINTLLDQVSNDLLSKPLFEDDETTIGDRFSHILEAEFRMSTYLYQTDNDEFSIDTITVESLKRASEQTMNRHIETIRTLSPSDLEKEWISSKSGKKYSYKFLIYHFLEHIATHRGQLAMSIRSWEDKN